MAQTALDLFAFGSRMKGPRPPRLGVDLFPDDDGMIGPEWPDTANGASTFGDVTQCALSGHYFRLSAGTELPEEIGLIADGQDIRAGSIHPPTHHTLFPQRRIHWERFVEIFEKLPWRYAGRKT